MQYILCKNRFSQYMAQSSNCDEQTSHKMFIQRLDDQFRHNLQGFIKTSSRFRVSSSLKDGMEVSPYIMQMRNPDIRQICTRLRIDLNCLVTCKTKKTLVQRDTCPFCHIDGKNVELFLLVCTHFDELRIDFENSIHNVFYSYDNLSLNSKLKYILDLHRPNGVSSCKFVSNIYVKRKTAIGLTQILSCHLYLIYRYYCNNLSCVIVYSMFWCVCFCIVSVHWLNL